MGWGHGPPTWAEMERVLSGLPGRGSEPPGDGGDSPAWSHTRGEYRAGVRPVSAGPVVPYAELHAHSAYSFLDGACRPEELVEEAVRLGLEALGAHRSQRFLRGGAVRRGRPEWGMPTVFGAELSLGETLDPATLFGPDAESRTMADSRPRTGEPDPSGPHLLVLARGQEGYRRLSRQMAAAHMAAGEKGMLRYDLDGWPPPRTGHWHDPHRLPQRPCAAGARRAVMPRRRPRCGIWSIDSAATGSPSSSPSTVIPDRR